MHQRPSPEALQGYVLQNVYRIEEPIGRGGTAYVYRALHLRLGATFAVKILNLHVIQAEQDRERFIREAQVQYHLHHPNIVRVQDFIDEDGLFGIVQEWCPAGDLESLFQHQGGPLPLEDLPSLLFPILDAIQYAHDCGLVHRDLKPQNILLQQEGTTLIPKLNDFGLIKLSGAKSLTQPGAVMGTGRYMSPEQLQEDQPVDLRSDIYSLGVLLYRWTTGRYPFTSRMPGLLMEVLRSTPPPPSEAPGVIHPLLSRCMAKEPSARFQSCRALRQALAQALATLGIDTPAETPAPTPHAIVLPASSNDTPQQLPRKPRKHHTFQESLPAISLQDDDDDESLPPQTFSFNKRKASRGASDGLASGSISSPGAKNSAQPQARSRPLLWLFLLVIIGGFAGGGVFLYFPSSHTGSAHSSLAKGAFVPPRHLRKAPSPKRAPSTSPPKVKSLWLPSARRSRTAPAPLDVKPLQRRLERHPPTVLALPARKQRKLERRQKEAKRRELELERQLREAKRREQEAKRQQQKAELLRKRELELRRKRESGLQQRLREAQRRLQEEKQRLQEEKRRLREEKRRSLQEAKRQRLQEAKLRRLREAKLRRLRTARKASLAVPRRRSRARAFRGLKSRKAVPSRRRVSRRSLDKRCRGGEGLACFRLAEHWLLGRGGSSSYKHAIKIAGRGCNQLRYAPACRLMHRLYPRRKNGVRVSSRRAWRDGVRYACRRGSPNGCTLWATTFHLGRGESQDVRRAAQLYRKACNMHDAQGCYVLGAMLIAKRSTAAQGLRLWRKSCRRGYGKGCYSLAKRANDAKGCVQMARKACRLGYRKGCAFSCRMEPDGPPPGDSTGDDPGDDPY